MHTENLLNNHEISGTTIHRARGQGHRSFYLSAVSLSWGTSCPCLLFVLFGSLFFVCCSCCFPRGFWLYVRLYKDRGANLAEHFVKLLKLVKKKKITELQAKQILNKFIPKSYDPSKVESKISDRAELKKVISKVIKENKKVVEDYRKGNKNSLNFLMGQVMRLTNRRADFKVARRVLEEELK